VLFSERSLQNLMFEGHAFGIVLLDPGPRRVLSGKDLQIVALIVIQTVIAPS
jgi:hypothetical protein